MQVYIYTLIHAHVVKYSEFFDRLVVWKHRLGEEVS